MTKQYARQLIEATYTQAEIDQMIQYNVKYAGRVGYCDKYVRRYNGFERIRRAIQKVLLRR